MPDLNSPTSAIYTLDNLKVLRGLNSACIDLVYLDPPFNTGRQWHNPIGEGGGKVGFSDIWGWDRQTGETLAETIGRQWEEERDYVGTAVREVVEAAVAAHSPQMGSYAAWMAPRLIELHRVLKPTGSVYLHCDPTAGHFLRVLMDAIFGQSHWLNEVEWKRTSAHSGARRWGPIHDRLIVYSRAERHRWNRIYEPHDSAYVARQYRYVDESERRYRLDNLTGSGVRAGESGAPWRDVDPSAISRHWAVPGSGAFPAWMSVPDGDGSASVQQRLDMLDAAGLIHWPERGGMPSFRRYLSTSKGRTATDVITDIPPISSKSKERMGYPTQKPLALLERIIRASSNEGDVVLDPFCGCATACIAAQKLGRRWIGVDIEAQAVELCRRRLGNELGFDGITQELTSPPTRTDVRQLELIPRNRALRLELWAQMQRDQGSTTPPCPGCNRAPGIEYMEVDHIVPRSRGGGGGAARMGERPTAVWSLQSEQGQPDMAIMGAREGDMTKMRPVGRPPKAMPPPIDAPPEAVARALLSAPPRKRKDWRFLAAGRGQAPNDADEQP